MEISYDYLLQHWELFLLILMRISTFIFVAPFFSIGNTPVRVKIVFSVFLSILIYSVLPEQSYSYDGLLGYAILILKESVIGLLIGYMTYVCVQCIHFAGHIIDINLGLSMATMYDPATKMQVNLSGQFYYYCIMLLMMISGLHQFLIKAIVDTYTVIPVGAMTVNPSLMTTIISVVSQYFVIGFRIALPVFITIMILNCILGILAKIAPQMNMFAVGMQIKILVGLFVLYFTVIMIPSVSNHLMEVMKNVIIKVVKGLY